jgi:hypothetical protein
MSFDPRTMSKYVYQALTDLRSEQESNQRDSDKRKERLKDQRDQSVELYMYLSTWGLLRLKAEEKALNLEGKKEVVKAFFACLGTITDQLEISEINGLELLIKLPIDEYLGLTGLGLALAQEFSFWANTIYFDIKTIKGATEVSDDI